MCPIVMQVGKLNVSGYWLFMAMGLLFSYIYFNIENKKFGSEKLPWYHLNNYCCLCILSIFIGGAVMGFLVNLPNFIKSGVVSDWDFFKFIKSVFESRAFYGGAIMLFVTLVWYTKHHRLNGQNVVKIFVTGTPLFMFFSRIGCFMGGCCYGKAVSWGIVFPKGSLAPSGIPLFPSQLAEAMGHLAMFIIFLFIKDKVENKYNLLLIYAIYYSALRFILEFFRGDTARGSLWIFSTSQWVSIILLTVAVIYISIKRGAFNAKKQST